MQRSGERSREIRRFDWARWRIFANLGGASLTVVIDPLLILTLIRIQVLVRIYHIDQRIVTDTLTWSLPTTSYMVSLRTMEGESGTVQGT